MESGEVAEEPQMQKQFRFAAVKSEISFTVSEGAAVIFHLPGKFICVHHGVSLDSIIIHPRCKTFVEINFLRFHCFTCMRDVFMIRVVK